MSPQTLAVSARWECETRGSGSQQCSSLNNEMEVKVSETPGDKDSGAKGLRSGVVMTCNIGPGAFIVHTARNTFDVFVVGEDRHILLIGELYAKRDRSRAIISISVVGRRVRSSAFA